MIKTKVTREDALALIEKGRAFHAESQFKDEPFCPEKCWALMESTLSHPLQRFMAFDSEYHGFIVMGISEHWFSTAKKASDFCLYVDPEYRGNKLVIRLLDAAYKWATEVGADDMTIFHNTGINMETAPRLFNKLGFETKGYIFTKEIACAE